MHSQNARSFLVDGPFRTSAHNGAPGLQFCVRHQARSWFVASDRTGRPWTTLRKRWRSLDRRCRSATRGQSRLTEAVGSGV